MSEARLTTLMAINLAAEPGEVVATYRYLNDAGTMLTGFDARTKDLQYKKMIKFSDRMGLPTPDDEHVLVWTMAGGSESIVTDQAGMTMMYQQLLHSGTNTVDMWSMSWRDWPVEPDDHPIQFSQSPNAQVVSNPEPRSPPSLTLCRLSSCPYSLHWPRLHPIQSLVYPLADPV